MLKSRNLDDQTYRQIVEAAEGRLPWLCPQWTDHNAHDPGITILELMAWYKEMQQYRLNRFGEALQWRLLKLAGITRRPAFAARCTVAVPECSPARALGDRLHTRQGVPFELEEPVPAQRPQLARICVRQGERMLDVGELLTGRRMTFQPFAERDGERSCLMLGFSRLSGQQLRLWFEVEQQQGTPRTPFADARQAPRILTWNCLGGAEVTEDETHALSVSGFVSIRFSDDWTPSEDGLRWLTVSLTDPGCEEEVRLSGIAADRFWAVQRETWDGRFTFDAKGLPGETFFLNLEGRTVLADCFTLRCATLERDGTVRPEIWHCVEDLFACGPRDRVFTYDPVRETVTFGDGEHGALLQGGIAAVQAASMKLSLCSGGNIPAGTELCFDSDEMPVVSSAATGGTEQETPGEAAVRLRQYLNRPSRCVSAADYEVFAKKTPGLRVAAAKALPAWDPDEPTGVSRTPTVTVVVIPAGSGSQPLPDSRFLAAVQQQLERVRPIGTQVKVISPIYLALSVYAEIYGAEADPGLPEECLQKYFEQQVGIGGTVRVGDISAVLQALPGVLRVRRVEIHSSGGICSPDGGGDLCLPRQGVPCLARVQLQRMRAEQIGE